MVRTFHGSRKQRSVIGPELVCHSFSRRLKVCGEMGTDALKPQEEAHCVDVMPSKEILEKAEARRATVLGECEHEEIPEEADAWVAMNLGG